MRFRFSAFVLFAFFAVCQAHAQEAKEFDTDLVQQLKIYLNKPPESHFRVEIAPNSPFPIPDQAKNNIRFSFQSAWP